MRATEVVALCGDSINHHTFDQVAPAIAAYCPFWCSSEGIIRDVHCANGDVGWLASTTVRRRDPEGWKFVHEPLRPIPA